MPEADGRIRTVLGIPQERWTDLRAGTLVPGTKLGPVEALFPRIEKTVEELRSMNEKPIDRAGLPAEAPHAQAGEPAAPGATQAVGAGATPPQDNRHSVDEVMKEEVPGAKVLQGETGPESQEQGEMYVDGRAE